MSILLMIKRDGFQLQISFDIFKYGKEQYDGLYVF